MGRDLPDLLLAHAMAIRRYLFFDQPMPAWSLKLIAQPTHVMIISGVYVRVVWISQAQLEETWLYILGCWLSKHNNKKPKRDNQHHHILDFPTCHTLSEVCRGRSPVYLQDKNNRPRESTKDVCISFRNLEQQIAAAISVLEPPLQQEGSVGWTYPLRDVLVDEAA